MMIVVDGGETKYYYHSDGLGSVIALSNNIGVIVEQCSYDVFGEPSCIIDVGNPYKFTERRYDVETGLYYYRARIYSPELGRFLQTDPIGYYDSMNLYAYCFNNPINWVDPWGLAGTSLTASPGAAALSAEILAEMGASVETLAKLGIAVAIADEASDRATKARKEARDRKKKQAEGKEPPGYNPKKGWRKLKGDQGYKDPKGNIWKKDKLHKDHWDVLDKKGRKIKEVDFKGRKLWPRGPKNKGKKC